MPKSKQYTGIRMPRKVLNSMGRWVNSKFAGLRLTKNTNVSDYHWLDTGRKNTTHTTPVVRTKENDGHNNPTRMRHAATKAAHALRRQA